MGRSRRGRVASSGRASSVVGDGVTMTEKRNLYLYLYLRCSPLEYLQSANALLNQIARAPL